MSPTYANTSFHRRRSLGHAESRNGHDADDTLQENMVDLILCDINLPVMYGLKFIKLFPWVANAEDVP